MIEFSLANYNMKKHKYERSAVVLGRQCEMSEKHYNFARFKKAYFKEREGEHLLKVPLWADVPKPLSLHTNQLISQKKDSQRHNNARERKIEESVLDTKQLGDKSVIQREGNVTCSEERLELLRELLQREEQELIKIQNELETKKNRIENELTKFTTKFKLYKYILPIETSIDSDKPLNIKVFLKKDSLAPTEFIFKSTDLHTTDITNSLWEY